MIDPVQPNVGLLRDVRRLRIDGSDLVIGARAFDVLAYIHANAGRVATKAELLEHVLADLNVEESGLSPPGWPELNPAQHRRSLVSQETTLKRVDCGACPG